jgi:hypothetical protein
MKEKEVMSVKKLCLAMAASGLCASVASAGHMGNDVMLPAAPPTVNVTIPQYQGSWMIALEAQNQQHNNGDFHYATMSDSQTNVPVNLMTQTERKVHAVDSDSDWGWAFELGYNFEGNGRDLRVNWTHRHNNDSDDLERQSGATLFGMGFSSSDDGLFNMATAPLDANVGTDWDEVKAGSRSDYDHIDLVFGQSIDFGQKVTLRAFGGLRYADIENHDKAHYRVAAPSGSTSSGAQEIAQLRVKSDFSGLGPRAGIDGEVRLGSGFSIVGTIAGSVLAGSFDQKMTVDQRVLGVTGAVVSGTFDEHKVAGKHRVVPELDTRLGLSYGFSFTQETAINVEVGYEVINYFDVKDTSLVSYFDTQGHENDFGMNGLYLRAQLDVA